MKKRIRNLSAGAVAVLVAALFSSVLAPPTKVSEDLDLDALFARTAKEGSVRTAKNTRLVDASPAVVGEVVVTIIASEGEETRADEIVKAVAS